MAALVGTSLLVNGTLSDVIINKGWLSRTRTRKMFSLLSGYSAASLLMLIPAAGCNAGGLQAILFLQAFGAGFGAGCDAALPSEMTKNFPAITFAIVNTIAMSACFIAPKYAGLILDKIDNKWAAWNTLFFSSGIFMIISCSLFAVLGSAERQEFDMIEDETEERPGIGRVDFPSPRKFSVF